MTLNNLDHAWRIMQVDNRGVRLSETRKLGEIIHFLMGYAAVNDIDLSHADALLGNCRFEEDISELFSPIWIIVAGEQEEAVAKLEQYCGEEAQTVHLVLEEMFGLLETLP